MTTNASQGMGGKGGVGMQAYDSFALGLVLLGVVHLGDRYGLQLLRFVCSPANSKIPIITFFNYEI